MNPEVLILGAGPGGLTAAWWLLKHGLSVEIVEKEQVAGGLMRAVKYKDYMLDFGYKHLYNRIPEVHELWKELLSEDYLPYQPRTGVLYKGHIFEKEKSFRGLRRGMPYRLLVAALWDMLKCNFRFRARAITTLQDYAYSRRGGLFTRIFSQEFDERFKGRNWSELAAPEALVKRGLLSGFLTDATKSTLKQDIWYHPARGTGQIVEKLEQEIIRMGGRIRLGSEVVYITHESDRIKTVTLREGSTEITLNPEILVSSLPLHLIAPLMGMEVEPAQKELSFRRGVVMIYLFLNRRPAFPHTSLQVSCPGTRMSRITNFGALGGSMVPGDKGCLCVEYFTCGASDLFEMSDGALFNLVLNECEKSGLLNPEDCADFMVIRSPNSDPAASWEDYRTDPGRSHIYARLSAFSNLYPINRTGTDKSTYAGLMAAKAILNGNISSFHSSTRPDAAAPWEM